MKVEELIKILSNFDKDVEVLTHNDLEKVTEVYELINEKDKIQYVVIK